MKVMKYVRYALIGLICPVLFIQLAPTPTGAAEEGEGRLIEWKEKVVLTETFHVEKGERLIISPGTEVVVKPGSKISIRVLGEITIRGEKDKVVKIGSEGKASPGKWNGIHISGSRGNKVEHCVLTGATSGISLVDGSVAISGSTFEDCRSGVEVNQKSLAKIEGSAFRRNFVGVTANLSGKVEIRGSKFESIREIGVVVQNGGGGQVEDSEFSGGKKGMFILTNAPVLVNNSVFISCEAGAIFRQVGKNSHVSGSRFENNTTGVLTVQFSYQKISDSLFKNNKVALDVREFSSPHITHNNFTGNELAVNLFRKSNSLIDFNVFLNNRTAMSIDFSSYPGVFNNNFERNHMHIKLGRFQSGDWEKRAGSKNISGKEASRRGSRNIAAFTRDQVYPERVNARENFWGTDLGEFKSGEMNMEKIWDGKDFGPERYEGFGDEQYSIDVVDFSGWKREPVKDAGMREKGEQ